MRIDDAVGRELIEAAAYAMAGRMTGAQCRLERKLTMYLTRAVLAWARENGAGELSVKRVVESRASVILDALRKGEDPL